MKKKELQVLRGKEAKELKALIEEKKKDLSKAKLDIKVTREKNLKKAKNLRHELSQILSLLREGELLSKEE